MITNNLKVYAVQILSFIFLILLSYLYRPLIREGHLINGVTFILSLLIYATAGFYLMKNLGSHLKNSLSVSFMSFTALLLTLFQYGIIYDFHLSDENLLTLYFFLSRPIMSLDSIFLPFDATIYVKTREVLEIVSSIIPVLFMWLGIQLKSKKKKKGTM